MADVSVQTPIKIVDPTTDTLEAAVLALSADNVVATTEGLVVAAFPYWFDGATWDRALGDATDGLLVNLGGNNDVTVQGSVAHDDIDADNPILIGGHANVAAPASVAENDIARAWFNLNGAQMMTLTATDGTIAGVTAAGLNVDTELAAALALGDAVANPTTAPVGAFLMGYDGTDWQRIWGLIDGDTVAAGMTGFGMSGSDGANDQLITTDASGHLQVDVLTGGGSDTPATPVVLDTTIAALAAGVESTTELRTAEEGGNTVALAGIDLASSVAARWEITQVDNDVSAIITILFTQSGQSLLWRPPHRAYTTVTFGATGGFDGFQVLGTNMDTSEAADLYATFYTED